MKTNFLSTLITSLIIISCSKAKIENPIIPPPIPELKTPKLSTDSFSNLTVFSVILGGRIIDTGGSKLSEQGIVVGLTSGPTVISNFNKFKLQADSNGHFLTTVIEVPANTNFYIKAYGINKYGVGYGNEVSFTSPAGKILPGGPPTVLTSQQEVNDFGANHYTTITNGIEIRGNSITDLTPLKSIVILGGALNVINTSLQNLRGLDSLEIIGSTFFNIGFIEDNPLLKDLSGLNNLKMIRGPVQIARNNALVSLNGLNNLSIMQGSGLGIYYCNSLQSLTGLEKLTFLDGDIMLNGNPALTDLKGLRNVDSIIGDVRIIGNNLLSNVDGFEKVKNVGILQVNNNPILTNLNGFKNLVTLEGLLLEDNAELRDLSAMKNLKTILYLFVKKCNSIVDLTGFSNLEVVTGRLSIYSNPNLISLRGLERLQTATSIEITHNTSLPNLKGLDSLKTLVGSIYSLTVSYNPSMDSFTGLENLRNAEGLIYMCYNSPMLNYCALKPFLLQYSGNNFTLISNGVNVSQSQVISSCP